MARNIYIFKFHDLCQILAALCTTAPSSLPSPPTKAPSTTHSHAFRALILFKRALAIFVGSLTTRKRMIQLADNNPRISHNFLDLAHGLPLLKKLFIRTDDLIERDKLQLLHFHFILHGHLLNLKEFL